MESAYPPEDLDNPLGEEEILTLKPFDYEEHDNFNKSGKICLQMTCHDRNSNSHIILIKNFRVFACVELSEILFTRIESPDRDWKKSVYEPIDNIYWDENKANSLWIAICKKSEKARNWKTKEPVESPFDFYFDRYKDIYYYHKDDDTKPYIYFYFHTLQGRSDMMNTINFPIWVPELRGFVKLTMHENKISTLRRLHSLRHIRYSQWLTVKGRSVPFNSKHRVSKEPVREYIVDYRTLNPVPEKDCSSWLVYPKLFSWDGEMYSENHKQMPRHKRPLDSIYLISVVFQYMEHPETVRRYCLCYGNCGEIEGVEVINFKSEKDLIIAFLNMFNYLDPDIVLGYNTTGFDYPYIIGRINRLGLNLESLPSTGRLINSKNRIYSMNWSSSGSGNNSITMLKHDGRIDIDMLTNIRRLYKLRQYTLQFVSMKYLNEGKHDIKAKDMFKIYEDSQGENKGVLVTDIDGKERFLTMTDVAAYCVQDSMLPIRLFDNRKIWYHLSSLSAAAGVSISDLFNRGEQIRCYSNIAYECSKPHHKKVLSNPQYFDYYFKGGFVGKPLPDVYSYVFTLDFASLYPSIMRAYNISIDSIINVKDWTKYDPCEYEINYFETEEPVDFVSVCYQKDLEEKHKIRLKYNQWLNEYEWFKYVNSGGQNVNNIDFTYKTNEEYELCLARHMVEFTQDDYNTMIQMGLTGAKEAFKVNPENPEEEISYEPDYFEDNEDLNKTNGEGVYGGLRSVKRRYEIRIIKKHIYEGIMSILESEWFQGRKNIKKLMKAVEIKMETDKDPKLKGEHSVYNAGQNARKIMMNSGYGFNGVKTGMLPALPVAILTTAIGRNLIQQVNDLLMEEYKHMDPKIVYNDTDSSMIMLNIKDSDVLSGKVNLKQIMNDMEDFINGRPEIIKYNEDGDTINIKTEEKIIEDNTIVTNVVPCHFEKYENGYVKIMTCQKLKDNKLTTEKWYFNQQGVKINKEDNTIEGEFYVLQGKKVTKYPNGMPKEIITEEYKEEDGVKKVIITTKELTDNSTVKEIIPAIKAKFRNELQMECENCTQMCPLKPKYYIKLHREVELEKILKNGPFKKDFDGNYDISTKGILTSKRGNAEFSNKIYGSLVNEVIFMKTTVETLRNLNKNICDFLLDKFDPKDLCKITELNSVNHYLNALSVYLVSQGIDVKPGDRVEYLVVRTNEEINTGVKLNVGLKCREYTMWMNDPNKENIDYVYYIEKGLIKHYDCLFAVGNKKTINDPRLSDVGYKPQFSRDRNKNLKIGSSAKHFVHFSNPIKMISSFVSDYMSLTDAEFAHIYSSSGLFYDHNLARNKHIAVLLNIFMDRVCKYINMFYPQSEI